MNITELVCTSIKCYRARVALGLCDTHYRATVRKRRPLYNIWLSLKQRCYNEDNSSYRLYGALGIKVCNRWLGSYDLFAKDMGNRPPGTVLDRIDLNDNFTPANCFWAPRSWVHARSRALRYTH